MEKICKMCKKEIDTVNDFCSPRCMKEYEIISGQKIRT